MIVGFPRDLLGLVLCSRDGGELDVREADESGGSLIEATLRCRRCDAAYSIRGGILDLLGDESIADERSAFELKARDRDSESSFHQKGLPPWHPDWRIELEVPATLRRLGDLSGTTMLELGCGTGLYTRCCSGACARILAVDFSRASLRVNAENLAGTASTGFLRAEVGRLRLRRGAFDVALTTLYSNLPTAEIRRTVNRCVREALRPGGRYLVSAHHQDLKRRLRALPSDGLYSERFPVFFQCFSRAELEAELTDFEIGATSAVCIFLPLLSRSRGLRPLLSRVAERIPGVNLLGLLLLATVFRPSEGHRLAQRTDRPLRTRATGVGGGK